MAIWSRSLYMPTHGRIPIITGNFNRDLGKFAAFIGVITGIFSGTAFAVDMLRGRRSFEQTVTDRSTGFSVDYCGFDQCFCG